MTAKIAGVQWDKGNLAKCQKHGLTVDDIEDVLIRNMDIVSRDARNSKTEGRYSAIGRTRTERRAYVVFTLRVTNNGELYARPLSARFMHQKEIDKYVHKTIE
jgi:uncharacterized DUF497 family protein